MENVDNKEEKISLQYKEVEYDNAIYNGITFKIKKLINPQEQAFLISKYINDYFFPKEEEKLVPNAPLGYLNAEYNLRGYIVQLCTNIEPTSLYESLYADTKFWELIISKIENYNDFIKALYANVEDVRQDIAQKNSLGSMLTNLFSILKDIIDELDEITPEKIEEMKKLGESLLEEASKLQKE
jgi:hypothetical protein